MKVTVTGANGFIGSHLVPVLIADGHCVSVINEPGKGTPKPRDVRTYIADITTGEGLSQGFSDAEVIIHLAARNHVLKETAKDPLAAYRLVNVEGTRNVIQAALLAGVKVFVHFSSVKAMREESDIVLDEDSLCIPTTPYGISKLESEQVVQKVGGESGIHTVIIRLPMVYGPGNKGNLPRMIRWSEIGYPFPLFKPDNVRSMIYVENVVAGIMAVLKKTSPCVSTYILKDSEDCSTKRIYSIICNELGKKARFLPIPAMVVRLGSIFSEDFRKISGSFRVSSSKIEKETGFIPPFSIEEGLARTVRWYLHSAH